MSRNSEQVAAWLMDHPAVEGVNYPGLASFEGHDVAQKYTWLADGEDDYGAPVNRYGHLMSFRSKAASRRRGASSTACR